jgi:hypothetical protein
MIEIVLSQSQHTLIVEILLEVIKSQFTSTHCKPATRVKFDLSKGQFAVNGESIRYLRKRRPPFVLRIVRKDSLKMFHRKVHVSNFCPQMI